MDTLTVISPSKMTKPTQKSSHFPDCFHRVTIKDLVVKDGKILLLKESPKLSGQWELPGGGLDFGEDIFKGLRREIKEETGLKIKKIFKRPMYAWTWRYDNRRRMDWFYSLVLAYKVELDSFDFKKSPECEDIGFFSKKEIENIKLCWQTNGLKDLFDPKDFE